MRARLFAFFAGSLALTAVCQTPGILALRSGSQPRGAMLLLLAIGSCGPTLVAIALSALDEGWDGIRALFARHGRPRAWHYLVALMHIPCAHLIGSLALLALGRYTAAHAWYPPLRPEQVAIAILAPLGEEYGWRGYALPRLQASVEPLAASVVIGTVWALWHVPTFFAPGAGTIDGLCFLPLMIAGSVVYTWLYNASGGRMSVILVAHLGAHLDNLARAHALGDGYSPLIATTAALVLFAGALVASRALERTQLKSPAAA